MGKVVHTTINSSIANLYNITKPGEYSVWVHYSHGLVLGDKTFEDHFIKIIVEDTYDHGNGD